MEQLNEVVRLFEGPAILHLGTCGSALIPYSTRVTGGHFDADTSLLTIFIGKTTAKVALEHFSHNEKAAVIGINPLTYMSYQLKGRYLSMRECTAEDYNLQSQCIDRLKLVAFPSKYYQIFNKPALSLALSFHINEVYNQSPGPNAGIQVYNHRREGEKR